VIGCPYANVESATTTDPLVIGATMSCVSTGGYGWVCTHGIVGVLQGVPVAGDGKWAALDTNVAGAVRMASAVATLSALTPLVGYYINAASASNFSTVYLTLE
jgi:hypothetical protein